VHEPSQCVKEIRPEYGTAVTIGGDLGTASEFEPRNLRRLKILSVRIRRLSPDLPVPGKKKLMTGTFTFDSFPIWLVFLLTVGLILLSIEIGYRVGVIRARKSDKEREAPIDSMVGSTLGLLAFMLAFTFGMASSRYDARKQFVVDEANAIRAADVRVQLLPEPRRSALRSLLLEYVDVRLRGVLEPREQANAIKRSEQIHESFLSNVASSGSETTPPERAALTGALIEIMNLHAKRLNAVTSNRIYGAIWVALYSLAALAMGMLGFRAGISGRRSPLAILTLALAFSAVLALINDLDRPQQGLVRVSQQALIDLQTNLHRTTPAAP